jgi:hypothetical protein
MRGTRAGYPRIRRTPPEARLYPDDLGEVNIAFKLPFGGCFNVEIFEAVTVQHDHAGFFRVARIDEHPFGH